MHEQSRDTSIQIHNKETQTAGECWDQSISKGIRRDTKIPISGFLKIEV